MENVFIGRQPIFNNNLEIYAFELLFRKDSDNNANVLDGDSATSAVLLNSLVDIGLSTLVGDKPAFINFTRNFIVSEYPIPLEQQQIVIEVLEDIKPDPEILSALQNLSERGYTIALDDYVMSEQNEPFLEYADIIKIEYPALTREQVIEHVKILKNYPVKILAEKLETYEDYEFCKSVGFDLFQGYFLSKPRVISAKKIAHSQFNAVMLLSKLQNPDININEVSNLIETDVGLSLKILRYLNSSAMGLRGTVSSVTQAVTLLGISRIKTMIFLLVMSGDNKKPIYLIDTGLVRAKMCEEIAKMTGQKNIASYFTVGLLSLLDTMYDCPMEDIISELPLSDNVKNAILHKEGLMGTALNCSHAFEINDWNEVSYPKIDSSKLSDIYFTSIAWAREQSDSFNNFQNNEIENQSTE